MKKNKTPASNGAKQRSISSFFSVTPKAAGADATPAKGGAAGAADAGAGRRARRAPSAPPSGSGSSGDPAYSAQWPACSQWSKMDVVTRTRRLHGPVRAATSP